MVFLAASYGLAQEQPQPATKAEASASGEMEIPAKQDPVAERNGGATVLDGTDFDTDRQGGRSH